MTRLAESLLGILYDLYCKLRISYGDPLQSIVRRSLLCRYLRSLQGPLTL